MPRTTITTGAIPHSVLTKVLDHCTPRFGEKTTTFITPCACTPSLLVSIKGGGGRYLRRVGSFGRTQRFALLAEHTYSSEPRYWHSPQSTPSLAETWEFPSLSRLTCTPYYRHPRCKIVQCPRTPLCWTYGPTAGTRINPCVTVLPLTSGTRNTQRHHSLGLDRRVRAPTRLDPTSPRSLFRRRSTIWNILLMMSLKRGKKRLHRLSGYRIARSGDVSIWKERD